MIMLWTFCSLFLEMPLKFENRFKKIKIKLLISSNYVLSGCSLVVLLVKCNHNLHSHSHKHVKKEIGLNFELKFYDEQEPTVFLENNNFTLNMISYEVGAKKYS